MNIETEKNMEKSATASLGHPGASGQLTQTAVFIKDAAGRYIFCNEAFARLIRAGSTDEVTGRKTSDLLNRDSAAVLQEDDAEVASLDGGVIERRITTTSGRAYTVRKSLLRLGGSSLLVGTIDGVPPAPAKKSPSADSQSRRYFSAFCRDARGPLNSIIGYAQIMLQERDGELLAEGARVIQSAARSLMTALDGAQALMGPAARVPEIERETFDLAAATLQLVESYSAAAGENGVEMRLKSTPIPLVEFHGATYKSILSQLIEYAISHTRAGWIEVGTKYAAGEFALYVRDTGVVLAPTAKSTGAFATGALNVPSVKRLASGLGGRVAVSGDPGSGTMVTVTFPGVRESGSVQRRAFEKTQKMRTMRIEDPFRMQKRILVVDGKAVGRRITTLLLGALGFKNVAAADGAEKALEMLRAADYAAVFCDLELPEMDAFEFLRRVRALPKGRRLAVHLVSADATMVEPGRASGFRSVLTKPVTKEALAELL